MKQIHKRDPYHDLHNFTPITPSIPGSHENVIAIAMHCHQKYVTVQDFLKILLSQTGSVLILLRIKNHSVDFVLATPVLHMTMIFLFLLPEQSVPTVSEAIYSILKFDRSPKYCEFDQNDLNQIFFFFMLYLVTFKYSRPFY